MLEVMGLTHVTVTLSPLVGRKRYAAEFLVDTGAIDCLAPAAALKRAGIKREGTDVYELATGETVELPYGFARVSFMGSETVAKVVFGEDDVEPLLGAAALESVGIGVDPVSRTLLRMTAKPLK
jgi:clan AA aspartic protease